MQADHISRLPLLRRRVVRTRALQPRRLAAILAVALVSSVAVGATVASPASAYTTRCGGPRCVLYLNRGETHAFAYGSWLPRTGWPAMDAVVAVGATGLRYIARGWYARGNCVAFQATLLPWESQGLIGTRC